MYLYLSTCVTIASHTQKRKQKVLTVKGKQILDRLNRNESFCKLASEYGVEGSTIYDIKKNHENIQKFVSSTDVCQARIKHPEVEEALYVVSSGKKHTYIYFWAHIDHESKVFFTRS